MVEQAGGAESFSGVFKSLTRDLFESQSSRELKNVVFLLKKNGFEKVVLFLIGVNGLSARRMDGRLHIGVSWSISPQLASTSSHGMFLGW